MQMNMGYSVDASPQNMGITILGVIRKRLTISKSIWNIEHTNLIERATTKSVERNEKIVPKYVKITTWTCYHFKLDFQWVEKHARGKWLIRGTKHRKDIQLQSLTLTCRIS